MDTEVRKKLVVPFIVFLGILGVNANSIVNGINQHNTTRVVIASVSTVIVLCLLIFTIYNANKNSKKSS
ncbi:MAG: hypothetical protein ABIN91_20560 [Mucilaginibacter sp.]|uniref:hypothetical protein n=1 Tax=Mucilaginibacter sp. TaxID=1882438 RepID=UPI003263C160